MIVKQHQKKVFCLAIATRCCSNATKPLQSLLFVGSTNLPTEHSDVQLPFAPSAGTSLSSFIPIRSISTTSGKLQTTCQPRRRRGAIRSRRIEMLNFQQDSGTSSDRTQYTLDDSICPPTHSLVLRELVRKHIGTLPKYLQSKPIAKHNSDSFIEALNFVMEFGRRQRSQQLNKELKVKVILDSGCGTGRSTIILGERHPDCVIIGVDRSLARLNRNKGFMNKSVPSNVEIGDRFRIESDRETTIDECDNSNGLPGLPINVLLLRADLFDFWHLCAISSEWQSHVHVQKHFLLYPNPYPKKSLLKHRFYAHPSFPLLMQTIKQNGGGPSDERLIVRSNWMRYLEEFGIAVDVWAETGADKTDPEHNNMEDGCIPIVVEVPTQNQMWLVNGPTRLISSSERDPMTNFEAKYFACGEPVYEMAVLPSNETQTW